MDIFSHAAAGASVGWAFGRPIVGALWGVIPDLVLGFKRRLYPNELYNYTHSFVFLLAVGSMGVAFGSLVPFLAVLSHLILDVPTHGKQWGPMLFYPNRKRFGMGYEWEWFDGTWWIGFIITVVWCFIWVSVSSLK